MGGTRRLLTHKSHRDGSPSRRNRPDVSRKSLDHGVLYAEDKQVTSETRRTSSPKRSGATTPIKLLIAKEMSIETEPKRKQTNVVARLMGLDEALPAHWSVVSGNRQSARSSLSSRVTLAGALQDSQLHAHDYFQRRSLPSDVPCFRHEKEYRDVYEVRQHTQIERRMDLVRQKFMEAKRLAIDEKLLQSKEFQDALEVLSSNRDLFLKFLEEPNSLFAAHLKRLHSTRAEPQTNKITVLKPVRSVNREDDFRVKKQQTVVTQPTKIVVLKPNLGNRHEPKPRAVHHVSPPELMEPVNSIRRDESLLSSVLSNGYVGDEDEDGDFSDFEIPSSSSLRSWDYSNRFGSPCSQSSFSRVSCSSEPSVIREAKKRLSERWSLMAFSGREVTETERSSSTLGEMLSISETKKGAVRVERLTDSSSRPYVGEEESKASSSAPTSYQMKNGDSGERSSRSLSRSRSLPVSSAFENGEAKKHVKDSTKSKSGRSSFKGRVSSLFFSKNKKVGSRDAMVHGSVEPLDNSNDVSLQQHSEVESTKALPPAAVKGDPQRGALLFKAALSLEKPTVSESLGDGQDDPASLNKSGENQNQPSPTSIIDAPFEDDTACTPDPSKTSNSAHSVVVPIESVARTLSWDDTSLESSLHDEERECYYFVQSILIKAGIDKSVVFSRWHSVDCPLNPTLVDKFLERKEESAKSRERRSNQRLVFDCVNYALLEIGRVTYLRAYPWPRAYSHTQKQAASAGGGSSIGDEVWVLIKDWFSSQGKSESGDLENSGLVVDALLRKEVGGKKWDKLIDLEVEVIGKEISDKLLNELIAESSAELSFARFR